MAPQRRRSRSATDDEEELTDGQQPAVRRGSAAKREPAARREPADQEPADRDESPAEEHSSAGNGSIRNARDAVRAALAQVLELTAKQPESIVGVQRTQDGWSICFEVIEDRRIPSSADILATYEATIDADGELMSFRRTGRYSRGRGDGNGGSTK